MSEVQGVITDEEIDSMAQEAALWLPTNVYIYRNKGGDNQQGGETTGKDLIGSNIPARLAPMSQYSSLNSLADKMKVRFPWILTVPANTDVEDEDEIHWFNRIFIVIVSVERDYKVTMRLLCDEIIEK